MQTIVRKNLKAAYRELIPVLHIKLHKPQNDERESNNRLDAETGLAHRADGRKENCSDARIGGVCGRWLPGESGTVGHWSCNQRLRKRPGANRQMDRPPG